MRISIRFDLTLAAAVDAIMSELAHADSPESRLATFRHLTRSKAALVRLMRERFTQYGWRAISTEEDVAGIDFHEFYVRDDPEDTWSECNPTPGETRQEWAERIECRVQELLGKE